MSTYNKLCDHYTRLALRVNELGDIIAHMHADDSTSNGELRITFLVNGWSKGSTIVPRESAIANEITKYLEAALQENHAELLQVKAKLDAADVLLRDAE